LIVAKAKAKLTAIPAYKPKAPRRNATRNVASAGATPNVAPDLGHIAEQLRPLAVRTADLAFMADNPLDHDDDEIEDMRALLRARGQISPLHVNRRTTPPTVIGGNKRLRAMLAEGWEWTAVVELDLGEDDAAALAIELNESQGRDWNKELLAKMLQRVGKLNLGEQRDAMMSRLAEAQKLIPKLDGAAASGVASKTTSQETTKPPTKCPACGHEWHP